MKKITMMAFVFGLLLNSVAMAQSLGSWHSVLGCDGGAVVVDNRDGYINYGRGGNGPDTEAQVVIRNSQVVQYFIGALHMQPGNQSYPFTNLPYNDSATGSQVVNGEWISQTDANQGSYAGPAGATIKSFNVNTADCRNSNPDGSCVMKVAVSVTYDGSGLQVTAVNLDPNTQVQYSANWYFHNCN